VITRIEADKSDKNSTADHTDKNGFKNKTDSFLERELIYKSALVFVLNPYLSVLVFNPRTSVQIRGRVFACFYQLLSL
jgi:hypothetical protein